MKRLLLICAALAMSGCATLKGQTVGQDLFAAYGTYDAVLTGAVAYAESPTASPSVVHALNNANKAVQPAVAATRAYAVCHGNPSGVVVIGTKETNCALFDFSKKSLSGYAIALRNATVVLSTQLGAR